MSGLRNPGASHRRRWLRAGITLCVALVAFIGLLGFHQPTAFAASTSRSTVSNSQTTLAALSLSVQAPARVAKPADSCALTEWLTPESQTITLGHAASITEHWSCGPAALLLIVFDFGDSNNTSYWCYLNCFSGSQTFTHTYTRRGTFAVYDGTYGGDYPNGTVVVR